MTKAVKKQALGRGLSALLKDPDNDIKSVEDKNADKVVGNIIELDIAFIEVNPFQPRTNFSEESLRELASSIKELGIIQLILQAIDNDLEIAFIAKFFKVSIKTVKIFKKCHKDNFQTKSIRAELATELLATFHHLDEKDIAEFCVLNIEEVEILKEELLSED